jgi:choline dehydrogenase-like flavoprotein
MSTYQSLLEERRQARRQQRGRGEGGATTNAATWGLGLLALVFLAWAIATTVIAANRVDPPGTFQCCVATGVYGDLCYDVIIVGGGTAGLAAARKISEDPTLSVLVIEEGPDYAAWDPVILNVSQRGFFGYIGLLEEFPNKYYYQIAGKGEPGLDGVPHQYRGGRTLGGSSSENYMLMYRGSDPYWDNFDAAVGSPGTFTAAAIHSTFEEFEWLDDHGHYASTPTRGNGQLPGQTWKLDTVPHNSAVGYDQENMAVLLGGALGLPVYLNESYNNPGMTFGAFPYVEFLLDFNTTSPEFRWTSRAAFAGPEVMDQQTYIGNAPRRLTMLLNSTVFKLLHAPGPIFTGVQFKGRDGIVRNAYAAKEVIVSSGVNTAPLLLRSGIGPAQGLQDAGITPVLVNENVGQRMTSHQGFSVVTAWSNITAVDPDGGIGAGLPNFCAVLVEDTTAGGVPGQRGYQLNGVALGPGLMLVGFAKMHATSVGSTIVHTGDPLQLQQMVTNSMTTADDLTSARQILRDTINGILTQDPTVVVVSIDNVTLADDTLLNAWISANTNPLNHYFMNANMGVNASTSVIDNRFRVWGASNLRVCDTQSYATLVDVHPSYSAAMLGQICGKLVLEDRGSPSAKAAHPVHRKPAKRIREAPRVSPRDTTTTTWSSETHYHARRDDVSLWADYQNAITTIRAKFTGSVAKQMISAIQQTADYVRLCASYCAQ